MAPTWELQCRGKKVHWDFTTFISPEIYSDIVIFFTKVLHPRPQVDIMFQPLNLWATILLEINPQMGCKGVNTYAVLSPYITPTYIITKRNKKASRVKTRMIKMKIKITGDFKITTHHFEEKSDDRRNGRKNDLYSKQETVMMKLIQSRL